MNKMTLDEIKKHELDIMSYIDEVCRKNDIQYFLGCGTLIGAIRHNGFLPWDDDIDILMFREDYNKLLKVFEENENYKLLSIETDSEYYYPFAKVVDKNTRVEELLFKDIKDLGVWVDVFPLDYYDSELIKKKDIDYHLDLHLVSRYKSFQRSYSAFRTIVKRFIYLFLKNTSPRKYAIWFNNLGNRSRLPQDEVCLVCSIDLNKDKWKTKWFSSAILHKFEDREFYVPVGFDEILKQRYGDYMQLPPEDQRVSNHDINAYIL